MTRERKLARLLEGAFMQNWRLYGTPFATVLYDPKWEPKWPERVAIQRRMRPDNKVIATVTPAWPAFTFGWRKWRRYPVEPPRMRGVWVMQP
jgi:hypothetical protein